MTGGRIARQCHRQLPDISQAPLDREEIDEGLSRMLANSVSAVDHGKMRQARDLLDCRDMFGPGDNEIAVLRDRANMILQILALGLA